jgi:hypothetical protein
VVLDGIAYYGTVPKDGIYKVWSKDSGAEGYFLLSYEPPDIIRANEF